MAKYSKKAQDKVGEVMHEMKEGKLRSGSGKKVTSRKQAVAIGLSEAREEGARVPAKKSSKPGPKKGAPKKTASKKKTAVKKSAPKKKSAKTPAKKRTAKKRS